jgi:hypothetical protein
MSLSTRTGRGRWVLGVALAYALVILLAPALHDARDALGRSPEHCAACLANPPATPLEPETALSGPDRTPVEQVEPAVEATAAAVLPADPPGRSPPA